ncbi:AAA family ATPase [Bacillaceae bacterium S4-13-56]
MQIEKIEIYNFAKWQNFTLSIKSHGITVIQGKNESGKSSLRKFLLYLFFGLPPKQREFFRPKKGGPIGGRAWIDHPNYGSFILERIDGQWNNEARCLFSDGEVKDESWLRKIYGGLDRRMVDAIYSFDVHDLQDIEQMDEGKLGDLLFGLGMSGTKKINELERRIQAQREQLFKERGKKPEINDLLNELKESGAQLHQLKQQEKKYVDSHEKLQELSKEITNLTKEKKNISFQIEDLDRKIQAAPFLQEYLEIKEKLSNMDEYISFPSNGIARHQSLKEQIRPLLSEKESIEYRMEEKESELQTLTPKDKTEGEQKEVQRLYKGIQEYQFKSSEFKQKQKDLESIQNKIIEQQREMGVKVEEDIQQMDLPFYKEEYWLQLYLDDRKYKEEQEKLIQKERQLSENIQTLENSLQTLPKKKVDSNEWEDWKKALQNIQQLEWKKDFERKQGNEMRKWQERQRKIFLGFGFIATLLFSVVSWFSQQPLYLIVAGLFLISTIYMLMTSKKENFQSGNKNTITNEHLQEEKQLQKNILEQEKIFQEEKELMRLLNERKKEKRNVSLEIQRIDTLLNEVMENQRKEIEQYPFLSDIQLSLWSSVFKHLKKVKEQVIERESLTRKIVELQEELKRFENDIERSILDGETFEEKRLSLEKEYKNLSYAKERIQNLKQDLVDLNRQQTEVMRKLAPLLREERAFFEQAKVEGEEAYYLKAEEVREKQSLEQEEKKVQNRIHSVIPSREKQEEVLREQLDIFGWQGQSKALQELGKELEEQLDKKKEDIAKEKALIQHLENSTEVAIQQEKMQLEKDRLQVLVKEWVKLTIQEDMLQRAKRKFKEERLPDLLIVTSELFSELTDGTYENVYAPVNVSNRFMVQRYDHVPFAVEELSQGTKEQLYIALRFALCLTSNQGVRFPFFLDDAFVHFDEDRRQNLFQALAKLSDYHQILMFTANQYDFEGKHSTIPVLRLDDPKIIKKSL